MLATCDRLGVYDAVNGCRRADAWSTLRLTYRSRWARPLLRLENGMRPHSCVLLLVLCSLGSIACGASDPTTPPIRGLTVTPESATIGIGESLPLQATLANVPWWNPLQGPDMQPRITWKTRNPAVATVSTTGVIEPKAVGLTIIEAHASVGRTTAVDAVAITVVSVSSEGRRQGAALAPPVPGSDFSGLIRGAVALASSLAPSPDLPCDGWRGTVRLGVHVSGRECRAVDSSL